MSQRRSTRLEMGSTSTSNNKAEDGDEDQSEEEYTVKKPRNKKRKASEENDQTGSKEVKPVKAKRARGMRGILRNVVEMPLDVLFEIFGRLAPLDLWHLAQTTKDLRALLMSRSSISIWREARVSNYPAMPECPDDLSEPYYASFMFGKHCFECLRNVTTYTLWDARVRLCIKCVETQCISHRYNSYTNHFGELRVRDLYPWIPKIDNLKKSRRSWTTHYYRPVMLLWEEQYKQLGTEPEKKKWISEKLEERRIIKKHAEACADWFATFQESLISEKASLINQRKAIVIERARTLGWADELANSPESSDKLQLSSMVAKACQKDLTERVLASLEPYINDFMTKTQSKRIDDARRSLLKERLIVLRSFRNELIKTISPNALCPSAGQIFHLPMVYDLVSNTPAPEGFEKEHLRPIVEAFPELILQWQEGSKSKLLKMITDAYDADHVIDEDTIFDLATTFFFCKGCRRLIEFPRVMVHSCLREAPYSDPQDDSVDYEMTRRYLSEGRWNERGHLSFDSSCVKLVGDIIEICGFDRHTTTMKEMNDAQPILECLSCHDCHYGRATLSWSGAVLHRFKQHTNSYSDNHKSMKLKLLEAEEATFVRQQLVIEQEKQRSNPHKNDLVCAICHATGNSVFLKKHVKTEHGKTPTSDDILPVMDCDHFFPMYRLWPPRDEEEHALVTGTEIVW